MNITKLRVLLGEAYNKIVFRSDAKVFVSSDGRNVYDQDWMEDEWSSFLKQHGILCRRPIPKNASKFIHVAICGEVPPTSEVDLTTGEIIQTRDQNNRTDCWIPLDLAMHLLWCGEFPNLNS